VAVVVAGEFDDPVAAGKAAREPSALIVASVPELTSRTISIEGTASTISSASSFSAGRRAEAERPLDRLCTAATTAGC
jgi:hypothetical protein